MGEKAQTPYMTVSVQLPGGDTHNFIDAMRPSSRPGGNRTYYEWVSYECRVSNDESLSIVRRVSESWYHFSGEHRDMHVIEEGEVAVYQRHQWAARRHTEQPRLRRDATRTTNGVFRWTA